MTDQRATELGQRSIGYLLWRFSLPAIVGMLAQGLYNVVDRIFVGRALGPDGLAGITVALPYMLVLLAFALLIGIGAGAMVSMRLGEKNKDEAEHVLGNALVLLLAASVLLTVVGVALLDPLLISFGASPRVLPYAHDYLHIIVLGTVFQLLGFGLNAVIRSEGSPQIAMFTLLIGVCLNVALAPLFIFIFHWGMQGAATATVISQAASAAWVVLHFASGRSFLKLRWKHFRLSGPITRRTLLIGSPLFVMQMAGSMINSLLNWQLNRYGGSQGDLAISVMGILYAVFMIVGMPVFGINQGAQPIIGYNYGARQYGRVKQTLLLAMLAASTLTVLGFTGAMLVPGPLIRMFNRSDPALAELGVHAMRRAMIAFPLIGFQIVSSGYFLAVHKPRKAMLLSLSRQVLILVPMVFLLPHFLGLDGVWLALPTADFLSALLAAAWLVNELRHLDRQHGQTQAETAEPEACAVEEWPG